MPATELPPLKAAPSGGAAPWRIFVIQHSHIDIGFTHRQETITDYHRQFLEQAVTLAVAPEQAARSPETRFKFTCEGYWAVEQFLSSASASQKDQFVRALREGTLELSALYLHSTELPDAGHLRDSLRPAERFAHEHGVPLDVAMSCDINGMPWGMADSLIDAGVTFLCTNINPHHGGFPFGKPLVPFYWRSPRGQKMLVWSGFPYHKANLLGLMGGYTPDQNPGIPGVYADSTNQFVDVQDITLAERKIFPMIAGLEESGYEHRFLPVMGSGLYTDNSPPTDQYCSLLAEWNAKHGREVLIQTATLSEFADYLKTAVTAIPTFGGDWPDWWSDGEASAPRETRIFRQAQRTKRMLEKLDPMGDVVGDAERRRITRSLLIAAEHTYGHSRTDSGSLLTQQVFLRKSAFTAEADTLIGRASDAVLRRQGEGEFSARRPFTYTVINTADVTRTDVAYLPVDSWEQPVLASGFQVTDQEGTIYAHQVEPAPRGSLIAVLASLNAGERRDFVIKSDSQAVASASVDGGLMADGSFFENAFYRLSWSRGRGIYSLLDLVHGVETLAQESEHGLGAPVYQIFPGANRSDAAGFLMAPRIIPVGEIHHGKCVRVQPHSGGALYSELSLDYEVAGTSRYRIILRLFRDLPRIELTLQLHKHDVADPEGLYAAFPFALDGGAWHLDRQGAAMRPGVDQLPGTCCDYYSVQEGSALIAPDLGVLLATPDVPLVHIGGLNLWKYTTTREPTGTFYSWLTNNKWETNFPRYVGGLYEFRYHIEVLPLPLAAAEVAGECGRLNTPLVVCRH